MIEEAVGGQNLANGNESQERLQAAEDLIGLLRSAEFAEALRKQGVASLFDLIGDPLGAAELKPFREGALQRLRAAGGDAWKRVADPAAYLAGDEP